MKNVVAGVGDNCAVNKAISRLSHILLVGCPSHMFNSAVADMLETHKKVIMSVNDLMKQLRYSVLRARLRQ